MITNLIGQDLDPLGPSWDRVHIESQICPGAKFTALGHDTVFSKLPAWPRGLPNRYSTYARRSYPKFQGPYQLLFTLQFQKSVFCTNIIALQ